jgi:hypothetical protein
MRRRHWTAVIVILLVLLAVGWGVPAINKVREAAARMHCTSYLKQWAMALHNSADTYQWDRGGQRVPAFPAGTLPHPTLPPEERWSWYLSTLPFIEQLTTYQQVDTALGPADPRNQVAAGHRFQQFVCPASGEYDRDNRQWKSATPLTHYVGVAGVGADAATLLAGHPRAGVFGYDRRTAVKEGIPDGSSNTLLVIETAHNPGHWAYGGFSTVRGIEPGAAPYIGTGRPFGGFHEGGWDWGKPRTHGCVAAMADGSVRSFSHATTPEVMEALGTVGGKEELPANW